MIYTAQEMRDCIPATEAVCLDEDYQGVGSTMLSLIIKECRKRGNWKPPEANMLQRLFGRDLNVWSKKNDCEDYAFRFYQTAKDYHAWSNSKAQGIAVGVVAIPRHAFNVIRTVHGDIEYLDRCKSVAAPNVIDWVMF